ncbi:cutinase family protein [Mycolicibacterium thermoresistibile]
MVIGLAAVAGLATVALSETAAPTAAAEPCPDVQVVFARGTGEAPGVGPTGQAFIDALRPRVGDRSFEVYAVNYPAIDVWNTGIDGIRDAGTHVMSMAERCPDTRMVLGGFSQGAAVMGFVTSAEVPAGVDPATVPKPLDPDIAEHVAAVVLFGTPNVRASNFLGTPPVVIGPLYQDKTVKLCAVDDPVCSNGMNFAAHNTYATNAAMVDQGAAFAADRLGVVSGEPLPTPSSGQNFGS